MRERVKKEKKKIRTTPLSKERGKKGEGKKWEFCRCCEYFCNIEPADVGGGPCCNVFYVALTCILLPFRPLVPFATGNLVDYLVFRNNLYTRMQYHWRFVDYISKWRERKRKKKKDRKKIAYCSRRKVRVTLSSYSSNTLRDVQNNFCLVLFPAIFVSLTSSYLI